MVGRVLVLDCASLSSFVSLTSSNPSPPLFFALQTSASPPLPPSLPSLPPPNLLHSLAAAVLIHCELSSIPCTHFTSYASPHFLTESFEAFTELQPLLGEDVRLVRPSRGSREWERVWRETVQGLKGSGGEKRGGAVQRTGGAASSLLQGANSDLFM